MVSVCALISVAVLDRLLVALQPLAQHRARARLDLLDLLRPLGHLVLEHGHALLDVLGVGGAEVRAVPRQRVPHAQVEGEQHLELVRELRQQHLGGRGHGLVVAADLRGQGLQLAVVLALHLRHGVQHVRDLGLAALRALLLDLLGALVAVVALQQREAGELEAGGEQQGKEAAGDDREPHRGPQGDQVDVALQGREERVRLVFIRRRWRHAGKGSGLCGDSHASALGLGADPLQDEGLELAEPLGLLQLLGAVHGQVHLDLVHERARARRRGCGSCPRGRPPPGCRG